MTTRTNTASWSDSARRWRVSVQRDGVRRAFYSSTPGRAGQREANAKADAWLASGVTPSGARVRDLYADFKRETSLTVGTSYKRQMDYFGDKWILPAIGPKKISALCDQDVQHVLDAAAAAGLSRKTIQGINAMMSKFFKYCRRRKLTSYRPDEVQIPSSARLKGKRVLQPADLVRLFNTDTYLYYGRRVPEPYIHAWRFQVLTGLRPGELRGLRRSDIHGRRIDITRSINDYGETTRGKNENAARSIYLSDMAYRELKAQLSEYPDMDTVFGIPTPQVYGKHFKRFCEDNGLQYVSPYELRHTFVSVVKRLPAGEIQPLVGHSADMDTFGVYGHALAGDEITLAQNINALFQQLLSPAK